MDPISGNYSIPERKLHFDVSDRIVLNTQKCCFYLRGENGIGKTSFVEKILIPHLNAGKIEYLYIGQDIRIQLYTLKALLAALGHRVMGADELQILKIWILHSPSARVFILDEFDKFFPDYRFIFDWSHAFIQSYVFITHSDQNRKPEAYADRYQTCNLHFESFADGGPLKKVRIKKDSAWF
jgi:hypothetical protein